MLLNDRGCTAVKSCNVPVMWELWCRLSITLVTAVASAAADAVWQGRQG